MKIYEDFVVPWVRETDAYSDKHMDFAWSHPEIIRMMSNENPIAPPASVLNAIMESAQQSNLYPGSGLELRSQLGKSVGLSADNVILGNGSTDIINIVINTFIAPFEEAIIPYPTFSMYEARLKVNGGIPIMIPIGPEPNFYWDINGIIDAVSDKTKLIFICTPNNPTGNQIKEIDLRRILEIGIPTFIDEAYYELEKEPRTWAYLIQQYPHAIVSRTMSKAFGLAGIRIGYAFGDANLVNFFNRVRIPWNVSLIAMAGALAALNDQIDQQEKLENNQAGRDYLLEKINLIPGLRAFPSEGNFVLVDASALQKKSEQIRDDMIARGIFIRPMSPHNMREGFIRITVGTPAQNEFISKLLRDYVAEILERV